MTEDFDELWAETRQRLGAGELSEALLGATERLYGLARTNVEKIRAATVQVRVGAALSNDGIKRKGLNDLRVVDPAHTGEVLGAFSDLTILGMPSHRWLILQPVCRQLADGCKAAIDFVASPSAETATNLLRSDWADDHQTPRPVPEGLSKIPANLQSELKLQVGWAALERYVEHRCPRSREILQLRALRMRPNHEVGWWENQLQKSVFTLTQGDEPAAMRLIENLCQAKLPGWAKPRINYIIAKYAVLASTQLQQWLGATGLEVPFSRDAHSDVDRAAMTMTDMMLGRARTSPQSLLDLGRLLESYPWLVFAGFCNTALRRTGRNYLGQLLLAESDLRTMHWGGRDGVFSRHAAEIEDPLERLELAARAAETVQSEVVLEMLRETVDRVAPETLYLLKSQNERLWHQVERLAARLSRARRSQVGRGGTYRAVVDGANVMYGTLGQRYGAIPVYRRLLDAEDDLKKAGFEVVIFVDRSVKHRLGEAEKKLLEQKRINNQLFEVRYADAAIVREFAKHIDASELVTNDRFSDLKAKDEFADVFRSIDGSRWRTFHLGPGGRLQWDVDLDRRPS